MRRVNMFIADGRIPGAIRTGNLWLIPEGAEKPADLRRGKTASRKRSLSDDLLRIIAATALPMPGDNPDAILDAVARDRHGFYMKALLPICGAIFRGQYSVFI